jgi:FtsZ-interacting cell division protein YlmF
MYESNAALTVEAWGPSLILLFAVLLAAWLAFVASRGKISGFRDSQSSYMPHMAGRSDELSVALESAVTLNSYDTSSPTDPSVHLGAVVRFRPKDYQGSMGEIMLRFREGRVVSVDLARMDTHQAARLVDFCSGMTAAGSGWIYQVADRVIVLTPPSKH